MRFLFGLSNKLGFLSSVHSIELVRFKEMWPFDGFLIGGSSSEERETMKGKCPWTREHLYLSRSGRTSRTCNVTHAGGCVTGMSLFPRFWRTRMFRRYPDVTKHCRSRDWVSQIHLLANMYGARPLHSKHQVSHCSSWLVFALVFAYVSRG